MHYIITTTRLPETDTAGAFIRVRGFCPLSERTRAMKFPVRHCVSDPHLDAAERFVRLVHWKDGRAPKYAEYAPPALYYAVPPKESENGKLFIYASGYEP